MDVTEKVNPPDKTKEDPLSRQIRAYTGAHDEILEQIAGLNKHYILCGGGHTGAYVVDRFRLDKTPFVLIEQDSDVIDKLKQSTSNHSQPFLYIQGDATEDEILQLAGINRAAGLITALHDDKENLFIILTARSLNPNLRIVTRVSDEKHNREKLIKAGANRVISTSGIGGLRMASEMIRPEVVKFLDHMTINPNKEKRLRFTEIPLASIRLPALAQLIATTEGDEPAQKLRVKDIGQHTGLLVVAVKVPYADLPDGDVEDDVFHMKRRYRFAPRGDMELHPDDILVVIGTQDKLDEVLGT